MILNKKQEFAIRSISEGKNIFLSGSGGVGKSVTIRRIISLYGDKTVVLSPTGIAALNVNGTTFHSNFKFPFHVLLKKDTYSINPKVQSLYDPNGPVKMLVIDEISMVRGDLLRVTDLILRKVRRTNKAFGGLQVIVVGDFYQLPPVLTDQDKTPYYSEYDGPYCFETQTWSEAQFNYIELDEIMRQSDQEMIRHLNAIRAKTPLFGDAVDFFNFYGKRNLEEVMDTDPVFLCSTNKAANMINQSNYAELVEKETCFYGKRSADFKGEVPVPEELYLKPGCKIIIVANSDDYKNGQIGYVTDYVGDSIEVLLEDTEQIIYVAQHTWNQIDYQNNNGSLQAIPTGSYTQYPIKLAWGITVHKAQGQTISNAVIDLGRGAFCHGQTYVALSRIKSMDGFALMKPLQYSDIIVDKKVKDFYDEGCRGSSLF